MANISPLNQLRLYDIDGIDVLKYDIEIPLTPQSLYPLGELKKAAYGKAKDVLKVMDNGDITDIHPDTAYGYGSKYGFYDVVLGLTILGLKQLPQIIIADKTFKLFALDCYNSLTNSLIALSEYSEVYNKLRLKDPVAYALSYKSNDYYADALLDASRGRARINIKASKDRLMPEDFIGSLFLDQNKWDQKYNIYRWPLYGKLTTYKNVTFTYVNNSCWHIKSLPIESVVLLAHLDWMDNYISGGLYIVTYDVPDDITVLLIYNLDDATSLFKVSGTGTETFKVLTASSVPLWLKFTIDPKHYNDYDDWCSILVTKVLEEE